MLALGLALGLGLGLGCSGGEAREPSARGSAERSASAAARNSAPTNADVARAPGLSAPSSSGSRSTVSLPPTSAPGAASLVDGGAVTAAPTAGAVEPPLTAADGTPLPQTDDKPSASSPLLRHHMELLVAAIANDDPSLATPAFFPQLAYEQVKDIDKPGLDWKHRLLKAFARDIHDYHRKLDAEPATVRLLGVEMPEERAEWMKRGREGNRLGYWRVKRAKLRLSVAGQERSLDITSCISWRGEWYVVHLHGFQ
jgi:hypothetical protein